MNYKKSLNVLKDPVMLSAVAFTEVTVADARENFHTKEFNYNHRDIHSSFYQETNAGSD